MQKVKLGTKVNRLGINRLNVGEGTVCRAILLDPDPQVKYVAYDEVRKRRVEVDQDMVLKYGLRPMTTFYYLVAKLNTDQTGNVIGDKFTVEYLQLSENLNNEFADLIEEQGFPKSIQLTKVKKVGDGGKDYSYVKPIPSQKAFEENKSLWTKINELRKNKEFINKCWQMIDMDTSMTKKQYIELLASENGQAALPQGKPAAHAALPPKSDSSNDFGSSEFSDGTDFNGDGTPLSGESTGFDDPSFNEGNSFGADFDSSSEFNDM